MVVAVPVLTPPRCGSSALAGAMRQMGVFMGNRFIPPDVLNERGYWEDHQWQMMFKELVGYHYDVREVPRLNGLYTKLVRGLIASRNKHHQVWGFKNPRAAFALQQVLPLIEESGADIRPIRVYRPLKEAARSLRRHSQLAYDGQREMSEEESLALMQQWFDAVEDVVSSRPSGSPLLTVEFDHLIKQPSSVLKRVAYYVFNGTGVTADVSAAVGFISPELRNFA